jgi:hypothetical protein
MAEAESDDDEEEIIKTRNVTFYLSFCMFDTSNLIYYQFYQHLLSR